MKKRTSKAKKTVLPRGNKAAPKKDQASFEQQVAELKAALERLPADRQEQFKRELEREHKGAKKTAE